MNSRNGLRAETLAELIAASASPVVLYLAPLDGERARLSWISDNVAARFGYAPQECLAPNWWYEHVHPDDRASAEGQWPAVRWADRVACDYRFRFADGSYRWLRDEMQRVDDAGGEGASCVGAWCDVTEYKYAEQALTRCEAQYRGIVEQSPHGIVIQQAGHLRHVNGAGLRLFSYSSLADVLDQPWDRLVAPEHVRAVRARIEACMRGVAAPLHDRWQGVRQDGSRFWLESVSAPFTWNGQPAVLSFLVDVSERQRLEAQLRHARNLDTVGELVGAMGHDFNNLLTVIKGYAELLLSTLDSDEPQRMAIDEIRRAGECAASLTRQLMALSRQRAGAQHVVDPNRVLQDLEALLHRMIGPDIQLVRAPHASRCVMADSGQLEQLILNLAVNGRDAMPLGGRLTIATDDVDLDSRSTHLPPDMAPGPYIMLVVSDNGCGMTPEVQERIFEPFFTTKDPARSSGLGLATVNSIVTGSGGRITVTSEPGQGSSFTIYLPSAKEELRDSANIARAPLVASTVKTILVVDDEGPLRTLARHLLEQHGYRVLEAPDGGEALEVCANRSGPIDLLITDVLMPGMSGQELAETARAMHPHLRVLFISGYTDDAVYEHRVQHATVHFLQKPFTATGLAQKVREVLDA
jgi:two-component system, cell cycle sensor histidine kinase and response regulator CckA